MSSDPGFRPREPRLPLLRPDDLDDRQRRLIGSISSQFTAVPNAVLTLLRHPALYEAWVPFASMLLNGSGFSARQQELVIMRTAVVIGSDYEWGQHAVLSEGVLDDDDRNRVLAGPTAPGWSALEAAMLTAVDELHESAGISDATWVKLTAELDERQLVELPMLVGHYHMMAFVLHALGVQREEGSPPLPIRPDGSREG